MQVPNRIPELSLYSKFNKSKVYVLQQITKYDDGKIEVTNLGCFNNENWNKDEETLFKDNTEPTWHLNELFCEENKYGIKPHELILRIVEVDMTLKEVYRKSGHFGEELHWKTLKCDNCLGDIHHGDPVIKMGNKTFCSYECLQDEVGSETYKEDSEDEFLNEYYNRLFDPNSSK
jgi:hypothetical protein